MQTKKYFVPSKAKDDECTLDVVNLANRFPPLFLHKNGSELLLPKTESEDEEDNIVLRISPGDKLTASCPGEKDSSSRQSFECLKTKVFVRDGVQLLEKDILSDLSCSKSIQETVSELKDTSCGPVDGGGLLVEGRSYMHSD